MKHGDKMKQNILNAGLVLWRQNPIHVTARNVGDAVGLRHSTVLHHFKGRLRDAVAEHAVAAGDSKIIMQLMATNHPAVAGLSEEDRAKHAAAVVSNPVHPLA